MARRMIRAVGIHPNFAKRRCRQVFVKLVDWLRREGCSVWVAQDLPGAPIDARLAVGVVVELGSDGLQGPGEADRVLVIRCGAVMPSMDGDDDDGVGAS